LTESFCLVSSAPAASEAKVRRNKKNRFTVKKEGLTMDPVGMFFYTNAGDNMIRTVHLFHNLNPAGTADGLYVAEHDAIATGFSGTASGRPLNSAWASKVSPSTRMATQLTAMRTPSCSCSRIRHLRQDNQILLIGQRYRHPSKLPCIWIHHPCSVNLKQVGFSSISLWSRSPLAAI
jgi:hypothetical protein